MKRILLGRDDRVGAWVMERTDGGWVTGQGTAIGLEEDGKLIAGVVYDSYNGASCCMHVAAVSGKRWMTREYLWACFAYPFVQLKVKKVLGPVGSANMPARAFDEHLGFVLEAALKDAHPDGELLIYSMTRSQCRWLNIRTAHYGKTESTASA